MKCLLLLPLTLLLLCNSCNDTKQAGSQEASGAPAANAADVNVDPGNDHTGTPPANPCMAMQAGSGIPMRGTLTADPGGLLFTPCLASSAISIADTDDALLTGLLEEFGYGEEAIYIQMEAGSDSQSLTLERLWRAAAIGDSFGCREDLSGLLFLANGNEPFWGIEIREDGNIALLRPADDGSGISETLYAYTDHAVDGERTSYNGVNPDNGDRISVNLTNEPCRDSMSGHYFGMTAEVSHPGGTYTGCAWPGEATEFRQDP